MKALIRPAHYNDMASVLQLVRELAEYEKAPEAVTADLSTYHQAFEEGVFDCIVAELAGAVVGTCIFYDTFSTWKGKMLYLEDFVVSQALRGHGVGRQLFEEVINIARDRQCVVLKWQVLDWNQPAINFYKKYDVEFDKEWWNGKMYL